MPSKSPAQHRLMECAAHTPGGCGGVPQSVGKEFVAHDSAKPKTPTEWDAVMAVRNGELPSPTRYGGMWLFAVRVTGTGIAYRPRNKEWVYRPPEYYLTKEFLERIKGLPILFMHTEEGPLHGKEFSDRIMGVLVAPWIQDDEVWGVAKIYMDEDAKLIIEKFRSTSPSISLDVEDGEIKELSNGEHVFVEGPPIYADHLAIVPEGVWDKLDGPKGISFVEARKDERNSTGATPPYSWYP